MRKYQRLIQHLVAATAVFVAISAQAQRTQTSGATGGRLILPSDEELGIIRNFRHHDMLNDVTNPHRFRVIYLSEEIRATYYKDIPAHLVYYRARKHDMYKFLFNSFLKKIFTIDASNMSDSAKEYISRNKDAMNKMEEEDAEVQTGAPEWIEKRISDIVLEADLTDRWLYPGSALEFGRPMESSGAFARRANLFTDEKAFDVLEAGPRIYSRLPKVLINEPLARCFLKLHVLDRNRHALAGIVPN